jgi:adenylate kinase family enzyme
MVEIFLNSQIKLQTKKGKILMSIAIILGGAPTGGKEENGKRLEQEFGFDRIGTSKVLEEDGYAELMSQGIHVSLPEVFESVVKRIECDSLSSLVHNTVFDGLIRNYDQAEKFPAMLRDMGFTKIVYIELDVSLGIALERRAQREISGQSATRPDGDQEHTFKRRFHHHKELSEQIISICTETCDEVRIINANSSKEEVYLEIAEFVCQLFACEEGEINWDMIHPKQLEKIHSMRTARPDEDAEESYQHQHQILTPFVVESATSS